MKQPLVKFNCTVDPDYFIQRFCSIQPKSECIFDGYDMILYYDTSDKKLEQSNIKMHFCQSTHVTSRLDSVHYGIALDFKMLLQKGIVLKNNSLLSTFWCSKDEFLDYASLTLPPLSFGTIDVVDSLRINHRTYHVPWENDIFTLHLCEYPDKKNIIHIVPDTTFVSEDNLYKFVSMLGLDFEDELHYTLEDLLRC